MNQAAVAKYFRKNPPPALDAGTFSCAVVIPAYDEAANLPAALDSLEQAADTCKGCADTIGILLVSRGI